MSIEKEKIVAFVEPKNPLDRNQELRNKIQHEIKSAKDELAQIYHQNMKVIPNNFPLPDIRLKDIIGNEHVAYISKHLDKRKFRFVIFQKLQPNNVDFDWIPKNGIRFVIEYVVSEGDILWEESTNCYSARVSGKVTDLKNIFLDIFLDILLEGSLSKDKHFKDIFQNRNYFNLLHSRKKVEFINKQEIKHLDNRLNYFPFSALFKELNDKKYEYNISELLLFWQKYLLDFMSKLNNLPTVNKLEELLNLIPKKYQGQINLSHNERVFTDKCKEKGLYKFVWLIKSPIGYPDIAKRQIDSIFSGNVKKGNSTIIPFAFSHVLNGLEHFLLIITFEKV